MRIVIPKLSDEQAKKINGGIDAVEASIKKHLPKELTFSGFSAEGEKTVGTLTLEFDSLDTYQTKISALSESADANLKPRIAVNSEGLVTGIQVEENFSSLNLLEWAKDGLVEDGVIASSDRSNIMEIGDSTVTFGEATYNSTSGRHMYVSEITDNGINHLAVDIAEKESSFDIRADLGYKKGTKYPEEEFKQYLENNRPKDAKVEDLGSDFNGVSISYSSASLKEAEESLAKLLGDPSFALKEAENDKEDSPFAGNGIPALTRTLDVTFNCSGLCSPQSDDRTLKFTPAEDWTIGDYSNGEIHQSGKITMYMRLKFSNISVQSTLGEDGGKVVATVSLNNKTVALAGDAINAFLNPQEAGELISKEESENTVYTLTLTGKSQEELNSALAKVSPHTTYSITPSARSGFFKKEVGFTYYNDFGSKFGVTDGKDIQHTVIIDGYSISGSNLGNSSIIKAAENPLSATGVASKFTLGAWMLILGIICCVLLGAGILFWKRKELAGKLQTRKTRQTALQQTPPLYETHAQETQAVSPREAAQTNHDATEGETISENQSIQTDPSLFSAPETHTSSPTQKNPSASLAQEDEWSEGDIS